METLKKPGVIAEKWWKVKPVSSYAKNHELGWDRGVAPGCHVAGSCYILQF